MVRMHPHIAFRLHVCVDLLTYCVVYDVANRETFDALPKWFTEIDTYVSTAVPKIIVGNKLDKVLVHPSFAGSVYDCATPDICFTLSRNIPDKYPPPKVLLSPHAKKHFSSRRVLRRP